MEQWMSLTLVLKGYIWVLYHFSGSTKSNYIIYWLTTFSLCIHQEFQYWMFIPPPHSIQLLSRMMVRGKTRKISRLLAKVMLAQIISCRLGTSQASLWVLDLDFRLFSSFFYIGRMYLILEIIFICNLVL